MLTGRRAGWPRSGTEGGSRQPSVRQRLGVGGVGGHGPAQVAQDGR